MMHRIVAKNSNYSRAFAFKVSRKLIGPEEICAFLTNNFSLKSLSVFVEFQRARLVRTITLRLQIRSWFIALFVLLFSAKPLSSFSGASWLIIRSTRRSFKCGSFVLFLIFYSFRHLKIDLVEELLILS